MQDFRPQFDEDAIICEIVKNGNRLRQKFESEV